MYRIGVDIGGTKIHIGIFDYTKKKLIIYNKKRNKQLKHYNYDYT